MGLGSHRVDWVSRTISRILRDSMESFFRSSIFPFFCDAATGFALKRVDVPPS